MKLSKLRFLKGFIALNLVAVLGLVVYQAIPLKVRSKAWIRVFGSISVYDDGRVGERGDALVVFVLIDTLRRDHIGAFGYHRTTTPNLSSRRRSQVTAGYPRDPRDHRQPSCHNPLGSGAAQGARLRRVGRSLRSL